MKNSHLLLACLCATCLLFSVSSAALAQTPAKIIFCKSIDDKMQPVEPGESFATNVISWISQAVTPYGKPTIAVTIYKKDGAREQVLVRQEIQVRPTWNVSAMRNFALPGEGTFLVSLDFPDGTPISSGIVTITKVQTKTAPPVEVMGDTIADIFNKYKPTK